MSKANRQDQFTALWTQFKNQRPTEVLSGPMSFSDFDGSSLDESRRTLGFCTDVIDAIVAGDSLKELSFNAIQTLQSLLQNVYNSFTQLVSSRDQGSYQNFAAQLDAFAYQVRIMGLPLLSAGETQLEQTREKLTRELERLGKVRDEVEKLRDDVRTLITPAVAGSLSQSFSARRDALMRGRIAWAVAALLLGGYAIFATFSFAEVVGEAMKVAVAPINQNHNIVWAAALIRSIVLLPIFAAAGVAVAQYKKERDFEEEYAHKAAVATSLPNYGDLTRDPAVRDQIVTGATNVIFTSPTVRHHSDRDAQTLHGATELIEAASKLVPRQR